MLRARLMVQGRVAEFFGPGFIPGIGDANVEHDRAARLMGWSRRARAAAAALDAETRGLLAAYAQGVSEFMASPGAALNPLIALHQVPLDPWQPEDCVGVWMVFSRHFASDGTDEGAALRQWEILLATMPFNQAYNAMVGGVVCDDAAAVVQQAEVPPATQQAMAAYAAQMGLDAPGHCPVPLPSPKFSQAWAVAGSRTLSGSAVLVGDARLEVFRPNQFYEWSVEGETFSARGAGIAGSPILLMGSTASASWAPTALGMDQADLYALTVDPGGHPGQYLLDGAWRDFEVDEFETVLVKGDADLQVHYRETVFGPVVTSLVGGALPGEEFAVRRVPFRDAARDAAVAAFRMQRAGNLDELYAALADWSFPAINLVMADASGRIGYAVAGDVPVRPPVQPGEPAELSLPGIVPRDGSASAHDWLEILPHGLEPHLLDPAAGTVHSANHMPIGSWYPIPIRFGTGGAGDTFRSRRLAELLGALPLLATPAEVVAPRTDAVHAARRDLVELGLWLRDSQPGHALSAGAASALAELEPWWLAGAEMDDAFPGSTLAWHMDLDFRVLQAGQTLIDAHGGGENGLNQFLKTSLAAIHAAQPLAPEEADYVDSVLADAWTMASAIGPSANWPAWFRNNVLSFDVESWKTLEGLVPPAGSAFPVAVGPVRCNDGGALCSPAEQSSTQVVELGPGPVAASLVAPGASELAGAHDLDQLPLLESEAIKPSPRTLLEVQASGPFTETTLTYVP
jgi:penicillin amidase